MMAQITAPHFVAGLVFSETKRVTKTADILGYMKGWSEDRVRGYCHKKKWEFEWVWSLTQR